MGSIPKIVSTPLKWASKQILNKTILRFPGNDPHSPIACTYCPEMCRFSCPSAVVSGNDAVTPCNKMSDLYKEETWPKRASGEGSLWPIYDCTGCGRCTEYCVYEMPVADQLFEARRVHKWPVAQRIAEDLTDEADPIGDLADELGDGVNASRRLEKFLNQFSSLAQVSVEEPKSLTFVRKYYQKKDSRTEFWGRLTMEKLFKEDTLSSTARQILGQKRWLIHESVWYARHLKSHPSHEDMQRWVKMVRSSGIHLVPPFAEGIDCIDCGGEGAYARLFPEQAAQMALDIWERDQHRVDGILCVSRRCAEHLRMVLGTVPGKVLGQIPVVALTELVK